MNKKAILTDLVINEVSAVDEPAQEHAVVKLIKRKTGDKSKSELKTNLIKSHGALTTVSEDHTHLIYLGLSHNGSDEANAGETTWQNEHSHPWVRKEDGTFVIGETKSVMGKPHTHKIKAISKNKGPEIMAADAKVENMDKVDDLKSLKAKIKRSDKIIRLSPKERAAFDNLKSDDEKDKFLEMGKVSRTLKLDEMTKAAQDSDPVIYTTLQGIEMRRSEGDAFIGMAKSNDELRKRLDASEAIVQQKELEQRAVTELPYLAGTIPERAALLKAVENVSDENIRSGILASLRSNNNTMSKAFTSHGVTSTIVEQDGSPAGKLESMAKALVAKDPNLSPESAYSNVLKTQEGQLLYAAIVQ